MNYISVFLLSFLICIAIRSYIRSCIPNRLAYVKVLCDFSDKVSTVIEAGLSKNAHLDDDKVLPSMEELLDLVAIGSLTGILAEVNKEFSRVKSNPFMRIDDPNERLRKKFSKYLPLLNDTHKKFIA